MMDFISVPLVVGIVFLGVYKLFELFVCRSERLKIIEKLSDKLSSIDIAGKMTLPSYQQSHLSFGALKSGCLMLGIGLGLLVGFFICINTPLRLFSDGSWELQQIRGIVYGACTLLFGGLSLLGAFFIEQQINKKKKKEDEA